MPLGTNRCPIRRFRDIDATHCRALEVRFTLASTTATRASPLSMSIEASACAVAARLEGYPAFAEVILEQQLSPRAVAAMLRMSASKNGMPRRHRACRKHGTVSLDFAAGFAGVT